MNMFAKILAFSPSDMKSDFNYFPFMGALGNIANGTQGAALMILAIVFIVAVAGWVISKVSNIVAWDKKFLLVQRLFVL